MYSIYSVGDGVILQHDVGHLNRPAIKLDDVISLTNSSVSQVPQLSVYILVLSQSVDIFSFL